MSLALMASPGRKLALLAIAVVGVTGLLASGVRGQHAAHDAGHSMQGGHLPESGTPTLSGQYAFATISEITSLLRADPATDWSTVDVAALREHLVDMHHVTISSSVVAQPIEGGARFDVTSEDSRVVDSIRRMITAHAAVMASTDASDWEFTSIPIAGGTRFSVQAGTPQGQDIIRALGFHGVMAEGDHHRHHHWMIATGTNPH